MRGGVPEGEPLRDKAQGRATTAARYPRFTTAAEAIRFAIEELPTVRALGAWMQVGDERFDGDDILRLYQSDHYPLQRRLSDCCHPSPIPVQSLRSAQFPGRLRRFQIECRQFNLRSDAGAAAVVPVVCRPGARRHTPSTAVCGV